LCTLTTQAQNVQLVWSYNEPISNNASERRFKQTPVAQDRPGY